MPSAASPFSSVKLPAALVQQAREAAQPQRRSVAGQIEYWATLGRIADETGLTVQEAREAIASYDARHRTTGAAPFATATPTATASVTPTTTFTAAATAATATGDADESLDAIEARFVSAERSGRLAQAVRQTVLGNRQRAPTQQRAA